MISIDSIKEKIINICQNYLDRFEGPESVTFNMLPSNASSDSWNVHEHTANFSSENVNGDCGPVACVYLYLLTQNNGRRLRISNDTQFEGSKDVRVKSFVHLFSLLDKAHKDEIFILNNTSRQRRSNITCSDVTLSKNFASRGSEFIQTKLNDFEDSCPMCLNALSNSINVTLSCCQTRYCLKCYIGQVQASLERPTIRDETSQTEFLANANFVIAQQIPCPYCRQAIMCVFLTNSRLTYILVSLNIVI